MKRTQYGSVYFEDERDVELHGEESQFHNMDG
jgi:hypothetical protein